MKASLRMDTRGANALTKHNRYMDMLHRFYEEFPGMVVNPEQQDLGTPWEEIHVEPCGESYLPWLRNMREGLRLVRFSYEETDLDN